MPEAARDSDRTKQKRVNRDRHSVCGDAAFSKKCLVMFCGLNGRGFAHSLHQCEGLRSLVRSRRFSVRCFSDVRSLLKEMQGPPPSSMVLDR